MKEPLKVQHKPKQPTELQLQLQQATSLPEITQVLVQVCEQLNKKTELHIHFIINSTVVGNNVIGSNNQMGSICQEGKSISASLYGNAQSSINQ